MRRTPAARTGSLLVGEEERGMPAAWRRWCRIWFPVSLPVGPRRPIGGSARRGSPQCARSTARGVPGKRPGSPHIRRASPCRRSSCRCSRVRAPAPRGSRLAPRLCRIVRRRRQCSHEPAVRSLRRRADSKWSGQPQIDEVAVEAGLYQCADNLREGHAAALGALETLSCGRLLFCVHGIDSFLRDECQSMESPARPRFSTMSFRTRSSPARSFGVR